ncbi:ArsR/SmtB family transcription factor [Streptococcus ovuberis]|uniref:ArsR family transcriptional regulator n=1 Tax=Streptococcus ovuberis TaxID=1936207 RepID=A0A7X6S1H4_9STRE|nr:ArsR family transcriptional regulator [Streptococcus ovuberis]NKZ20176.1 ArsR family transcriptional regulator [Streptococcus ovuberis]
MAVHYSAVASDIMEQCFIPIFLASKAEREWDFSNKEREILGDVLPIMEELRDLFLPYEEKIKAYHLMGYGLTLLQCAYLTLVDEGNAPQTMEDVHEGCLGFSAETIQELLRDLVNTEIEHMNQEADFWERLEQSSMKAESKWYMSLFYRNPLASMKELVDLSRKLVELYQPYLEKGRAERQAYAEHFSLEEFLTSSNYFSQYSTGVFPENDYHLYLVSPWLLRFASYNNTDGTGYFIVSCRVDQLLESHHELDVDTFTTTIKVISDATRYNVLVELTKPHAKSKDIAESLDITGAAVSFHTQKLINAQLLVINRKDKDIKYNVNKALLREVIAKLQNDFALEEND